MTLDMKDIYRCVICGKNLTPDRTHVDTCGERCFKVLLVRQRAETWKAEKEADHA